MTFIDNVVVEKDDDSLLSDRMVVIYKEGGNSKSNDAKIERMDAEGHVKIFSQEFIGSGDFGHYEPNLNQFTLEKNVIINNGTSIASGDKFIYNTVTKKGHFIGPKDETHIRGNGGDKRVLVVIGNDAKENKKKPKNKETNE